MALHQVLGTRLGLLVAITGGLVGSFVGVHLTEKWINRAKVLNLSGIGGAATANLLSSWLVHEGTRGGDAAGGN